MTELLPLDQEAALCLGRLLPRLEEHYLRRGAAKDAPFSRFRARLERHFPALFAELLAVYGGRYDLHYHLEQILLVALEAWLDRPAELRALDRQREADPGWFQRHTMVGGVCYVDLHAGTLAGLRGRLDELEALGLTYLHLMPLFASPAAENDGGYAVSDYRRVDPRLGTMEELRELAAELRGRGISLVLDFVFNHTSDEHRWARQAREGDPTYQRYYWMFDRQADTLAYGRTLREIFPHRRGGSFSFDPRSGKWVWTTFNSYQWDLNYQNPVVFRRMLEEMLALANVGVEVLRMDAVAFIWKRLGSDCENQPEAHALLRAYNRLLRLAAPAVLFKSEAIVHPDEVARYIAPQECQLSYNPLLMALLWESLATRRTELLRASLQKRLAIDPACAWVNYVRCHDDIGWTFSDEDAGELGIRGGDHRGFLNAFYTGRFAGSFARGLPFGENPRTGDCRIAGTLASLAGLEAGLTAEDPEQLELAISRILLLHGVILSIGGIPLIYLGDELAQLNDYSFGAHPERAADARWVHRIRRRPEAEAEALADPRSPAARVRGGLLRLIELRKEIPALGGGSTRILELQSPHLLGYLRRAEGQPGSLLVLCNFAEQPQTVGENELRIHGGGYHFVDRVSGEAVSAREPLTLGPYQQIWLEHQSVS